MRHRVFFHLMAWAMLWASTVTAQAQTKWGAVAYTAGAAAYYSQWNHNSEAEAYSAAMKRCTDQSRQRCEIQTFSGQNCLGLVAVVTNGKRGVYWTRDPGLRRTQTSAQTACARRGYDSCLIRTIVCANGMH